MPRFGDIDLILNETLRVARVLEVQKAGKILLGMPFTGMRKNDMVDRFVQEFHRRFVSRDEQNDILYRFQTECLDHHTALSRLSEKYRVKLSRETSSSNSGRTSNNRGGMVNGGPSSNSAAPSVTSNSSVSHQYQHQSNVRNAVAAAYASHAASNSATNHFNYNVAPPFPPPSSMPSSLPNISAATSSHSATQQSDNLPYSPFPAGGVPANIPSPYYRAPLPHRPPPHRMPFVMQARQQFANHTSSGPSFRGAMPPQQPSATSSSDPSWRQPHYAGGRFNFQAVPSSNIQSSSYSHPSAPQYFAPPLADYNASNYMYPASSSAAAETPQLLNSTAPLTTIVAKQVYTSYYDAELALRPYGFRMDSVTIPSTSMLSPAPPNYSPMMKDLPRILYARIKHQARMPFYRNIEVLVPPIRLHNVMSVKSAAYLMGSLRFAHSPDRLLLSSNNTSESRTDLLIRFFKIDENETQLDTLPPNVTVEIRSAANRVGGMNAGPPPLTLYRTTLVRFKKTKPKHEKPIIIPSDFAARERQIEVLITYTPSESDYEFAVGIFRAQTVSIEEEVASIRQKPLESSLSRQSILRELKPNAAGGDDDIGAAEVSSLPLKCPISKSRIKVPCRSSQCTVHHTCDAYSFVEMNFERPTWRCFLCNRDVYLQDLRFELFVDDLLKKMVGTSETVNFVLNKSGNDLMIKQDLSSEGSGVALSTSSGSAGNLGVAKKSAKVSTSSSKNDAESSRKAGTTATAKDDVICLSSSDDEDKMKSEDMDVVSSPEQGKRRGKKLSPSDSSETSSRLENQESQAAESSSSSDEGESGDKSENDASSPDVDVAANPAHSNSEIPSNRPRSRTTGAVLNRRFQMMKKRIRPGNKNSARSSKTAAVSLFASTSSAATAPKKSNLHSTVDASGHEVIDLTLSSSDEETPASLSTNANSDSRRSSASTVAAVPHTNSSAASKSAVAEANERRAAAGSSSSQSSAASTSMPPAVRTPTTPSSGASMLSANVLVADAVVDGLIAVMNRGQADRRVPAPPSVSNSAAAVDASNRTAPSSAYQQYAASRNAASSMPQSYPTLAADAFSMSPYGAPMLVSPLPPSPSVHRQITASPTTGSNYLQNMPLLPPPPSLTIHVVHTQQQPPSYGPPRFARQSSQSSLSSAPQPFQQLPPPLAPVNLHLIPLPSPRIISPVDNNNSNITLPSYNGTPMSTPAHSHQNSPGHQQQQSSSFAIQQSVANFDRALSISSKSPRNMDTEAVSSTSPTPTDAGTINTHSSPPLSFDSNSNITDNDRTPTTDTTTARSSRHNVNSAASAEENFDDLMDGMEEIDESVVAAMFGTNSSYTLSDSHDMDALPVGGSVAMKSAIATSSMSKANSSGVNHKSSSHERTENARGSSQHDASLYQATTSAVAAEPSEAENLKDVRLRLKMSFVNGKAASATVLGNDSSARAASNSHNNSSEYSSKPTQAVTESPTRSVGNKLTFRLTSAAASTAAAAQPPAVEVRRPPSFNKTGTSSAAAVVSRTSASSPGASRRSSIVPLDLVKRAGSATTKNAASLNSAVDKTAHVPPLTIRLAPSSSKSAKIARVASPIAASPPPDADGFSSIPWASSPEDNENAQDAAKSSRKSLSSSSSSSDDGFSARRRRRRDKRRVPPLALKLRNAPLRRRVAVSDENSNSPIPSDSEIAESATTSRRAPNNSSSKSKRGQPQKRKTAASRYLGEEQSDDEGERTNDTFENLNEMLEDFGDEDDNVLQPAFPKLAVKRVEPARSESEVEEADDDRNVASRLSYNTAASRCSSSNDKNRRPPKNKTVVADEDDDDDAAPARSRSNATLKPAKQRSRRRKASQDEDANSGNEDEQQQSFQRVSYSTKHGAYDADLIAPSSEEDQQQGSDSSSSSDSEDEPSVPVPKISIKALPKSVAPAVRKRAKIVGSDDDDDEDADSDPDFNPARKSQADDQDSIWIGKRKNLCNGRNSTTGTASTGAAAAAKRRRVQIAADDSDDEGEREAAVLSKRNAKPSKLQPLATTSRTATRRAGRVITPENRSKAKSRHNDDDDEIDDDDSLNDFIAADSGDES